MFGRVVRFLGIDLHATDGVLDRLSTLVEDVLAGLLDHGAGYEVDESDGHQPDEHEPTNDVGSQELPAQEYHNNRTDLDDEVGRGEHKCPEGRGGRPAFLEEVLCCRYRRVGTRRGDETEQ